MEKYLSEMELERMTELLRAADQCRTDVMHDFVDMVFDKIDCDKCPMDEALKDVEVARNEPLQFGLSEAVAFYQGCHHMFEVLTPGFEVEIIDGHHELKGV